jgi:O-antigen/teichoic acid export membrane protein
MKILRIKRRNFSRTLQPLSLSHNFLWTFIGNLVYGFCQWGILVLIAKLGTPEKLGQYTLGLAIVTPIFLFFNLNLRTVQVTDSHKKYSFEKYLKLRIITSILALLATISISFLGQYNLNNIYIILIISISKLFESASDIVYGLFQQNGRMDQIAKSMVIKNFFTSTVFFIVFFFSRSLFLSLLFYTLVGALVFLFLDLKATNIFYKKTLIQSDNIVIHRNKFLKNKGEIAEVINLIYLSLPVGLIMTLLSLNGNIPRYFIEQYLGTRELGIFSAIAYIPIAGYMFVLALGQAALTPLTKYYFTADRKNYIRLLLKLVNFSLIISFISITLTTLFGKKIITLLYDMQYSIYSEIFTLIMIWGGITYIASSLGYGTAAANYFRSTLFMSALLVLITMSLSFWLIPSNGLYGSVIALIVSGLAQLAGSAILLLHAIKKLPCEAIV